MQLMQKAKATYLLKCGSFGTSKRELYFNLNDSSSIPATDFMMSKLRQKHGEDAK
jgi:hypothetical protein